MDKLPLPPTTLPALAPLLLGDLWGRWAKRGAVFAVPELKRSIAYLRLKPHTSCRIAVFREPEPSGDEAPPTAMLLYLFPSAERAEEFHAKHSGARLWNGRTAYPPFIDPQLSVVAMPFPNDRELPGLRHIYRHHRLKNIVLPFLPEFAAPGWKVVKRSTRLQLVRYKTGRRAVFRYKLHVRHSHTGEERKSELHLKAEAPKIFSQARNDYAVQLGAAIGSTVRNVPRILGTDPARFLTVRPWYPGVDLTDGIRDPVRLARAALALARLHATPANGNTPLIDSPVSATLEQAAALCDLLPLEADRLARITDRLVPRIEALELGAAVLLHGDFHPGQVVFADGDPLLIDLDRCGLGHPALDLGSFLAHADELGAGALQAAILLEAYRSASGYEIDPGEIAAGHCLGLLRRCARPFRELALDWPERVAQRLDRLERALGALD